MGCFLFLQASVDSWEFALLNVYAPTADRPDSQLEIFDKIEEMVHESNTLNLFIGGDLNCCLNPDIDSFVRNNDHNGYNRHYGERARPC